MLKRYSIFLIALLFLVYVTPLNASLNNLAGMVPYTDEMERWDKDNYIYSNYQYGFGWNLPTDYEWKRVMGHEKHTIFRAESDSFYVFANVQDMVGNLDLWQKFSEITELLLNTDVYLEHKTGQITYERTFEKCNILGKHAIKTTFKEYLSDSRYENPVENYVEEYLVVIDGYLFILAVKLPQRIYNDYDCAEVISNVFKGFRLATKY